MCCVCLCNLDDDVIKYGNNFRVTGPLCGEFTGHRCIPLTKACDAELWCFLWPAPEQKVEQTIETLVIWDAKAPIMTSMLYVLKSSQSFLVGVNISMSRCIIAPTQVCDQWLEGWHWCCMVNAYIMLCACTYITIGFYKAELNTSHILW